ncbi:MAG: tetratricopeptide repeat protein [Thermoplasmatales archaeon]|nr:tetratricopeptide repeat protein [Thermoplasmatales archaeon]
MVIVTTGKEKVLLCLEDAELPQFRIAEMLNMRQAHVSRALKQLTENGMVDGAKGHIPGVKKSVKIYSATENGKNRIRALKHRIGKQSITVRDLKGVESIVKFSYANNFLKKNVGKTVTAAELLTLLHRNVLDVKLLLKKSVGVVDFAEEKPGVKHFYGRKNELDEIKRFMSSDSKILSIRGIAGIGKTTLMSNAVDEYRIEKNVFWHRFSEFSTVKSCLKHLSEFLSMLKRNKLRGYIYSKEKIDVTEVLILLEEEFKNIDALLVYDDAYKIKEEVAGFFREIFCLLRRCKNVKVMVAGRRMSGLYDRQDVADGFVKEIILGGLDREASRKLLKEKGIKQAEKIYRFTGGHPLMLEIIKSEKIVGDDIYSFLKNEIYDKLNDEEKEIMGASSVFRFPFSSRFFLENNIPMDTVDGFVDGSMMERLSDVYHLHDIIRGFIYERLTETQKRRHHRTAGLYYENEKGDRALVECMYHFTKADDNRRVVAVMVKQGEKLVDRGFSDEIMALLKNFNEKTLSVNDWAVMLLLKGKIYDIAGKWDNAMSCYNSLLKLSRQIKDNEKIAETHLRIGDVYAKKSMWDTALENYRKTLKMSEFNRDRYRTAYAHFGIGSIYHRKGETNKAIQSLNKSLSIGKGFDAVKQKTYRVLGNVYGDRGDYDKAVELYKMCLNISKKLGDKYEIVRAYNNIGAAYDSRDMDDEATRYYEKQIKLAEGAGFMRGVAYGMVNISGTCWKKNLEKAVWYCEKGMKIFKRLDEKMMIASAHAHYGFLLAQKKNWRKAVEHFNEGIKVGEKLGSWDALSKLHFFYGRMYKEKGELRKAKTQFRNALKYYRKLGNKTKIKETEKEISLL